MAICNMPMCVCVAGCPWTDQVVSVWMRRVPGFVGGAGAVVASFPLLCTPFSCPSTKMLGSESWGGKKCLSPSMQKANRPSSMWVPVLIAVRWSIVVHCFQHIHLAFVAAKTSLFILVDDETLWLYCLNLCFLYSDLKGLNIENTS